nr:hypothetical protein [Tanacetum cinerariifolium]
MIDDLDSNVSIALMDDKKEEKKAKEAKVAGDDQVQGRKAEIYQIDMDHASKVLSMQEDEPAEVQEVVDVVTTPKLITEVVTAASESVTPASTTIFAAEPQVLAAIPTAVPVRVVAASTRRRKRVVIRDPEEESTTIIPADTKSKDKGKGIMVEEPKPQKKKQQDVAIKHVKQKAKEDPFVQRYQVMKKKPQTEAQARKNMIMYLKNVAGFKLDYFKGMSYDDIRPIFKAKFNSNIAFLLKTKEQLEEHLEIVPDEDDDVYTEATSLARKMDKLKSERIKGLSMVKRRVVKVHKTTASRRPARVMVEYILHQAKEQDLDQVILNGDSLVPTRVVEGVLQLVAPTTAEQRLARKNELKARGTLLMAFSDKHQLKFNSHKDAKTLMEAIEKRFGTASQNLAFVSSTHTDSTTDSVSAVASVSAICAKLPASPLLNVDSLSNVVNLLKVSTKTGRNLGTNVPTSMGFDMSKVECYNCQRKGHFARECRTPKDPRRPGAAEPKRRTVPVETSTSNALVSQCDGTRSYDWSYQVEEEPANFALVAFSSSSSFDTKLSPTKPEQDLSHTTRPIAPIIEVWVSDSEEESETKATQFVPSFAQSSGHVKSPRHSVPQIETSILAATPAPASPKSNSSGKRRNRKTCFVCKSVDHLIKDCDYHTKKMAQPTPKNYAYRGHHKQYTPLTHSKPQKHMVPTAVLTQSKPVSNTAVRLVSAALPSITVTRPRCAHHVVTKSKSSISRHITRSPTSKTSTSPLEVTAVKAPVVSATQGKQGTWGNPQQVLKDKGVIDSGCSRHITGNMSYLSDFKELNGGYVAFGGNPKGDETSPILQTFISGLENQLSLRVKVIRSDNGTEFKNSDLNKFCGLKGIKKEFSVPSTPQQNCIAERKNRTLIEAARTLLADSLLPIPFWAEAVNTDCYVHNRVLVTKPHNKTPYEHLHGRTPSIGFMRPFGCPVTILNTLDPLGKFQGKVDEGFIVGHSVCSKAFRVFNSQTRIIQETLHVNFLENKPNVAGTGPTWLFDIDCLTRTMNYQSVTAGNQTNSGAGFQDKFDAEKAGEEVDQTYLLFPVWSAGSTNPQNNDKDVAFDGKEHDFDAKIPESVVILSSSSSVQTKKQDDNTKIEDKGKSPVESFTGYRDLNAEFEDCFANSSNEVNAAGSIVSNVGQNSLNSTNTFSAAGPYNTDVSPTYEKSSFIDASQLPDDSDMPELDDITYSDDEDVGGAEADFNNLESSILVSPIITTRIHKDHHVSQIISDLSSTTQTRSMTRAVKDQGGLSQMFDNDFYTCMFACFLSQKEPKRVHQALKDPSWIKAIQEELLQFKMQKFWVLFDLPYGKRAIGHTQEEGIDYEEVFAPVARIEAIRLFLAYASFMGFLVYQMDVKSAFLYGTIEEEVYVCQPPGFEDPNHPDKVYKVVKALYGLHQAPRVWYETLASYLLENGFQRGTIDQTLFIKKQKGDILLVQIYVDDIIFGVTNKDLCKSFEKLMKDRFQMSSMGEFTFFFGLRVKQKKDGIFISQDKYVAEILSKFGLTEGKSASTPIHTEKPLLKDPDGEDVDVHTYRSMIGSLMYLTSSRPDIMFAVCAYARFQVTPKASHLHAAKMIFRYIKVKTHLGFWYPKDSRFNLVAYSDSDYASTNDVTRLQALVEKKKVVITEATIREALRLDDAEGVDCLSNEEIFAELARMGYEKPSTKLTFYKAFFSSQWKFLIHTILQSMSAKRTS